MKLLFTFFAFTFVFVSCKKDTPTVSNPSITVLQPRCENGTAVAIPFNVSLNGSVVTKIELYKVPSSKISQLTSADNGMYTLYDPIPCPKQSDNVMYYFVITKQDGSQIATKQFQVYF